MHADCQTTEARAQSSVLVQLLRDIFLRLESIPSVESEAGIYCTLGFNKTIRFGILSAVYMLGPLTPEQTRPSIADCANLAAQVQPAAAELLQVIRPLIDPASLQTKIEEIGLPDRGQLLEAAKQHAPNPLRMYYRRCNGNTFSQTPGSFNVPRLYVTREDFLSALASFGAHAYSERMNVQVVH